MWPGWRARAAFVISAALQARATQPARAPIKPGRLVLNRLVLKQNRTHSHLKMDVVEGGSE